MKKWSEIIKDPEYKKESLLGRKDWQDVYFQEAIVAQAEEGEDLKETRKVFDEIVAEDDPIPELQKLVERKPVYDPDMGLSPGLAEANKLLYQKPDLQYKKKSKTPKQKKAEDKTYKFNQRYFDEKTQTAAIYKGNGKWEKLVPVKHESKGYKGITAGMIGEALLPWSDRSELMGEIMKGPQKTERFSYADEKHTMLQYERAGKTVENGKTVYKGKGKTVENFTPTNKIDLATGAIDETWTHPAEMAVGLLAGAVFTPAGAGVRGIMRNVASEFTMGLSDLGVAAGKKLGKKVAGKVSEKFSEVAKMPVLKRKATVKKAIYDDMIDAAEGADKTLIKKNVERLKKQDLEIAAAGKKTWAERKKGLAKHWWSDKAQLRKALDDTAESAKSKIKAGETPLKEIEALEAISRTAENAKELRFLQHGAANEALLIMKDADKSVFKKMRSADSDILGEIRESLRSVEIAGRKTKKGTVKISGEVAEHQATLKAYQETHPELYDKLVKKSKQLDGIYNKQIEEFVTEGHLTRKAADDMIAKGEHYNPRMVLEKLDPLTQGKYGKEGTYSGMSYLETGTQKTLLKDPRFLLNDYIGKAQSMVFRARAGKALHEFAQVDATGLARVLKKGAKIPSSETAVKVRIKGKDVEIAMPNEIAAEWKGLDPLIQQDIMDKMSKWSGTKMLKAFATGVNPFFPIRNCFRDMQYLYASPQYSAFLPKFFGEIGHDYGTVMKDMFLTKIGKKGTEDLARKYSKIGGGFGSEGLTRTGRFKVADTLAGKEMRKVLDFAGAAGEFSEKLGRLAHMKRAIRNGASDQAAVFVARDALDFGHGGLAAKSFNTISPFFNVGIQGTRGMYRFMKSDPKKFAWKMGNLAAVATGMYAYNTKFYKEDYDKIPAYLKATNWIIMLPLTYMDDNEEEQRRYLTIPKDHSQMFFTSLVDTANQAAAGHDVNTEQAYISAKNFLDVVPGAVGSPIGKAALGWQSNLDLYRNRDIWNMEDFAGPIHADQEFIEGRTPKIYELAGKATKEVAGVFGGEEGISPVKAQYAVNQFVSSSNAYANFFGIGLDYLMKEMAPGERTKMSDRIDKELGMGLSRRTYTDVEMIKKAKAAGKDVNTERFKKTREFEKQFKQDNIEGAIESQPDLRKDWAGRRVGNKSEAAAIWEVAGKKNYALWKTIAYSKSPEASARMFYKVFKDREDYEEQKTKAKTLAEISGFSQNLGDKFSEYLFFIEADEEEKKKK